MQPPDPLRAGLGPRYVQRCRRWVDPDDLDAALGEQAGEGACAAADIQHASGTEVGRDHQVVIQIVAVLFHEVIDLGQPRHGENGVSHTSKITDQGG
jgi:hypothetical protein